MAIFCSKIPTSLIVEAYPSEANLEYVENPVLKIEKYIDKCKLTIYN